MSIESTELRIGNWLYGLNTFDIKESFFQVENIYDDQINVSFIEGYNEGCAKGTSILITAEILKKKLGLKQNEPNELGYTWFTGSMNVWMKDSKFGVYLMPNAPCKYLHHLQNICFVSTGKELQIKDL